ncbi:MAG TPA: hypothetical protein VK447_09520 [Myxococcaceae bacterium]|nr:hypothetical protein [Myxococcaceae bacterium]
MKKTVRWCAARFDKALVAWVALVLTLTFPASALQRVAATGTRAPDRVEKLPKVGALPILVNVSASASRTIDGPVISSAAVSHEADGAHDPATDASSGEAWEPQVSQELEDDFAHEEDRVCVLLPLEMRRNLPVPLEPESPHARRLKRPPCPAV